MDVVVRYDLAHMKIHKIVLNVYIPQDSQFKEEAQNYANELAKEYKNVTIKVSYFK